LFVRVLDSSGAEVATDDAVVAAGAFAFTFTNIDAEGGSVDYYADINDNGSCDAPPTDHVWRSAIPATHVLATVHNTDFTPAVCAGF
jgi:hypothetical protein